MADFGGTARPEVLGPAERRRFLAAFDRNSDQGQRDYTIGLCLIDLGLRGIEAARLRLQDIDLDAGTIAVPPAKAGRGRELPLPKHVARELGRYLRGRPATDSNQLFVGHSCLRGRPLSAAAIRAVVDRAYRRCRFDGWHGTHRLRHSFATRLYSRGATTKEIADLLGHRFVATTDRYTQVSDLRALALPWPA